MSLREDELAEFPASTTTISTVAVQSGRAKVVLAVLRGGDWIRVRVHQMEPDLMEVGSTLEEALTLRQEHEQVLSKLQAKEGEVRELLSRADTYADSNRSQAEVYSAMAASLGEAWRDLNAKLELRGNLLDQSITFHQSAQELSSKMEQAQGNFTRAPTARDLETARSLLQQHNDMKNSILEASKQTLDLGQSLLERIRQMGMHADIQNRHATTAACYGIEHLLELLHDRRRHLEELWNQRKQRLEQCLQLCQLDQEVNKILEWFRTVGAANLSRSELGTSYNHARSLQEDHNRFELQARDIQEQMLRLLRTADQLLRRASLDAEGIRQRLQLVDRECEDFMVKLDNRRKNVTMAVSFFNQAETALTRLGQIESQLAGMDLPRNSAELAEHHATLSNAIVESSTPAFREGRLLLERVSMSDSGADGVRRKMEELEARCSQLETMCKARRAEAWERSQSFLAFQEKYNALYTWITQVGQATLSRHGDMGSTLASAKDFLDVHEQLYEDIRERTADLDSLSDAVVSLVKSGDQEAQVAAEKVDALNKMLQRLQRTTETRIQLSLLYVSFLKLSQQVAIHCDGLEHIVRSETEDLQDLTDSAVASTQESWTKTAQLFESFEEKGKSFLQNTSTISDDLTLEVRQSVHTVERLSEETRRRMTSLGNTFDAWLLRVSSSKQFKSQWHQFVQDARKTIDWVMRVEREFFLPYIAGHLGNSLERAQEIQRKLDEFGPVAKKAQEEIERLLSTAELLALKGDTKGQKEQMTNELIKVHQRFQARINEYQILLKMTIQFFRNLHQLDEVIQRTEQEYQQAALPADLSNAERMLDDHKRKKHEVSQLINFTADEGEKIVRRVRQQDAGAAAQEDVRHVLDVTDEYKARWNSLWEEQERRLQQNLQICQFNFDLRQIHSEIDELHQHLQARRGSYGGSLPAATATSQAFRQFEMTVELIEKKIESFISTAELMVQGRHYDAPHIRREIDQLRNKWSTFHTSVRDYRSQLDASLQYFQLYDQCEAWVRQGNELLISVGRKSTECRTAPQARDLIAQLEDFVTRGKPLQEERLQKVSDLARQIYGDQGQTRVRTVVIQYQDLMQSFEQADNELSVVRDRLEGKPVEEAMTRETQAPAAAPPLRPPRIVQHLKNAEVDEGIKFTFECRIDSDAVPDIHWFKDNLPLTSPDYETRYDNGVATLTIEETFSEDTARYTCRVTNPAGTVESSAHLNVRETHQQIIPPDFTRNLKSLDVVEGMAHALECHVTGMPSPTVSWFKDDLNIDSSPDYVITKINGTCCLKIRRVTQHHSARYTCRATNPGGEASSSARVSVIPLQPPVFNQPLHDVSVPEGKGVRMVVRFTASPTPEVSWFRGQTRILPSSVYKITVDIGYSTLDITEAFAEDSSTYTVLLKNAAGETRSSCQVTVEPAVSSAAEEMSQASTDVEGTQPTFMHLLSPTKSATEGSRVRLDCVIVGQPEPEVIWYKNDKPVKESKDIQLLFEGDRCTLVIREVYLEDSGSYRCVARNPHGRAESMCKLTVEPVSELSDASVGETSPPKFTQMLRDLTVKSGQRICLQCRVTGHPLPTVQWFKDNKLLESSPDFQITAFADVHSLTIPEVFDEDSGQYQVKATNIAGEAKCFARLAVTPAPEQPPMTRREVRVTREAVTTEPPEFRKLFSDLAVLQGQPAVLECVITGSPKPKVHWEFNGEPLVSQDYIPSMEGDTYRLTIPEVFDEDAGRFTVVAENSTGRAVCSALLSIMPSEGPALKRQRVAPEQQLVPHRAPTAAHPPMAPAPFAAPTAHRTSFSETMSSETIQSEV